MPGLPKVPAAENIDVDEAAESPACSEGGVGSVTTAVTLDHVVTAAERAAR